MYFARKYLLYFNEISAIVRNIVILIRKERNIPKDKIEILINDLEDYRVEGTWFING